MAYIPLLQNKKKIFQNWEQWEWRTLEEQDSMARHELGGNPELNIHKDVPTSAYIKLPPKDAFKETNNGKKIKIMSRKQKLKLSRVAGFKNLNIKEEENKKRTDSSVLNGRGDEVITAGDLITANSKVFTVEARMAAKYAASSTIKTSEASKVDLTITKGNIFATTKKPDHTRESDHLDHVDAKKDDHLDHAKKDDHLDYAKAKKGRAILGRGGSDKNVQVLRAIKATKKGI